jgi:hypothetical protein
MYVAGGTTVLLDQDVIPVVNDGEDGHNGGYMKNYFVADIFGQTEENLRARTDWTDAPPTVPDGYCLYMATKWIEGV